MRTTNGLAVLLLWLAGGAAFAQHTSAPSHSAPAPHMSAPPAMRSSSAPAARAPAPPPAPRYAGGPSRPIATSPSHEGPVITRGAPQRPLGPGSSTLHTTSVRAASASGYGRRSGLPTTAPVRARASASSASARGINRNYERHRSGPRVVFIYGGGAGWQGYGYAPWLFYPWLDADLSASLWYDSSGGQPAAAGQAQDSQDATVADASGGAPVNEAETAAQDDPDALMHPTAASMDSSRAPATLVFKDGRAPLRTANYVVSPDSITVSDQGRIQVVPLGQIDVAETNRINADAGNDLKLPE